MGIFDIFGTGDQQAAAQSQIQGLEQGYNLGTGYTNQAIGSLNTGAGNAGGALASGYGNAATSLTSGYGSAGTALTSGYGNAANAINAGYGAGSNLLSSNYTKSIAPYLQNYTAAAGGVNQLGNVLGLNGPAGSDQALQTLQNTPGYQFQQQQGDDSINAAAAANGTLNSGNQMLALSNYNQGLAGTTYNNYVSQLQPYLGAANSAAGGVASGYQGLGTGLANASFGGANAQAGLATGLAAGQAGLATGLSGNQVGLDTGLAGAQAGIATGLGSATAAQQDQQAQMGWGLGTGTGNANANADLAGLNASGNFWNLLGGLGGMKTSGGGTVGGNLLGSFGGGGGGVPGAIGATSLGGAPLSGGGLSSIMAMFSDERLKENIEPVGSLYDATNVYRYNYKGDPTPRIGLIAQEVEKTRPDAVIEIGGYKAVDYGKATQYASELSRFMEAA